MFILDYFGMIMIEKRTLAVIFNQKIYRFTITMTLNVVKLKETMHEVVRSLRVALIQILWQYHALRLVLIQFGVELLASCI